MKWQSRPLSDFLVERKGRIKHGEANRLNLPRIRKIDFSGNVYLESVTQTKTDMIRVQNGDLVISGINASKGAIAIFESDKDALATIHYSSYKYASKHISVDFLKWFFKSSEFIRLLKEQVGGGIKTELKAKHILPLQVRIPSLAEQQQIANWLDRISDEHTEAMSEIAHQETLLAKLKQAILHEAIQGKLTAAWRAANPDVEPASQLLERVRRKKQRLVAAKKIRKEKPLPPIAPEEIPFEIPEGWAWCRLGDLCEKTGSGSTPRGGKTAYISSGIPFLRSQNVHDDGIVLNGLVYIPEFTHTQMGGSVVYPRDVLLNITGSGNSTIGRSAIVHDEFDEANVNQHVSIIRPVDRDMSQFVHKVLISSYFQRQITKVQTGAGRKGLPKNKMDRILIPVPPQGEQAAIIERVESLLASCRQLEAEIGHSRAQAENLLQAVLKEAFTPKTV